MVKKEAVRETLSRILKELEGCSSSSYVRVLGMGAVHISRLKSRKFVGWDPRLSTLERLADSLGKKLVLIDK